MRYSCKAVVGHGQICEPNYQCDACAAKQKYMPRIEKLEALVKELLQSNWDNSWPTMRKYDTFEEYQNAVLKGKNNE